MFLLLPLSKYMPGGYVVRTLPEKNIVGDWVKNELLDCLKILQGNCFNARGVVCDEHSTNALAYKNFIKDFGQSSDDLFIMFNGKKHIQFIVHTVHRP